MNQKNNQKLISEKNQKDEFVGPRALFDPNFIPNRLFNRKKEEKSMNDLINDALLDNFPAQISLYGMKGVGKTVLVNKTIKNILRNNKNLSNNEVNMKYIHINCENKTFDEIIFNIINTLSVEINYSIPAEFILNANISKTWNLMKHMFSKLTKQFVIFLDNIEYVQTKNINKLLEFCLNESIIVLSSYNVRKCSPFLTDIKSSDYNIQLDKFSSNVLYDIGVHRCEISIKNPIENNIINYIVDLVSEFDKKVPGSIVRVLKELYPLLDNYCAPNSDQIRDICRYQFDGFSIDELSIAEFISETDLVERVFLDNVSGYFNNMDSYYIPYKDLNNLYKMANESLEEAYNNSLFNSTLNRLEQISLLLPSKTNLLAKKTQQKKLHSKYYLTVPPELLNDMLDVAFGAYEL